MTRQKRSGGQKTSRFQRLAGSAGGGGGSRVGGWRASFRVRWPVRRFRSGPQSGSPGRVSSPPLIKPDVRISRIRLSDGIMPPHVAQSGVSEHCVALIGSRQWPCPAPFLCRSRSQAPFLGRRYPASSVVRACPPPCRPGLVLADFRLASTRHRQGFPCCCAFHLPRMPTPLPRRKRSGASVACFPARRQPSPFFRRVGFRVFLSRPAQRSLAFRPARSLSRPRRPFDTRVLQSTSLPP